MNLFLTHAPLVGLVFFFVLFLGIALWAYLPRNKARLQELGAIPLKDENNGRA